MFSGFFRTYVQILLYVLGRLILGLVSYQYVRGPGRVVFILVKRLSVENEFVILAGVLRPCEFLLTRFFLLFIVKVHHSALDPPGPSTMA